jgi:hypothetical protein
VRRRVTRDGGVTAGERDAHRQRAAGFADLLAGHGLSARPATPQALSWLLYQSVGFGLAPLEHPGHDIDPGDILALTERFDRYRTPYGSTVRILDRHTGAQRYVAVLTVGRMEPLTIPQVHEPWLHLADSAGYPVEVGVAKPGPTQRRGRRTRRWYATGRYAGPRARHPATRSHPHRRPRPGVGRAAHEH